MLPHLAVQREIKDPYFVDEGEKIPQYNQVREYDTMASIVLPHLAIRRERVVQVDPALRRAASITAAVHLILMLMPLWYVLI